MLLNVEDYRRRARRRLPRFVFDYIEGVAEDGVCMRRNRLGLERLALVPQCLRDTRALSTTIELFGQTWRRPFAVAPMGLNGLVRPDGDLCLARAAAASGVPFVLSTASNERLESIAESAPAPWLQLYVMRERGMAEQLVARARKLACPALVLTVDVPVSGMRERDMRNGFRLPFRPSLATLLDLCRHPLWLGRTARHGMPAFVNLVDSAGARGSAQAQAALLARQMDRGLIWEGLGWLRRLWDGPLLIKGVLHPGDARRALAHGVDGIIVSNHGGRQLDAAPASIDMLPLVLDAVGGRLPVLVDSGFRRGSDIAKALALGAKAVFVGRPLLYGLACGGEDGAKAVLAVLSDELERTMTLIGAAQISEIDHDLVGSMTMMPASMPLQADGRHRSGFGCGKLDSEGIGPS